MTKGVGHSLVAGGVWRDRGGHTRGPAASEIELTATERLAALADDRGICLARVPQFGLHRKLSS